MEDSKRERSRTTSRFPAWVLSWTRVVVFIVTGNTAKEALFTGT